MAPPARRSWFWREGARKATKVVSCCTRPAGGTVSVSGCHSPHNKSTKLLFYGRKTARCCFKCQKNTFSTKGKQTQSFQFWSCYSCMTPQRSVVRGIRRARRRCNITPVKNPSDILPTCFRSSRANLTPMEGSGSSSAIQEETLTRLGRRLRRIYRRQKFKLHQERLFHLKTSSSADCAFSEFTAASPDS